MILMRQVYFSTYNILSVLLSMATPTMEKKFKRAFTVLHAFNDDGSDKTITIGNWQIWECTFLKNVIKTAHTIWCLYKTLDDHHDIWRWLYTTWHENGCQKNRFQWSMCCPLEDHNIPQEHKSCISPSHLHQHTMAVDLEICHTFKCHHRRQKIVTMSDAGPPHDGAYIKLDCALHSRSLRLTAMNTSDWNVCSSNWLSQQQW